MSKTENLYDFYNMPANEHLILEDQNLAMKHINVFRRWNCSSARNYTRRDFYRLLLIEGNGILKYADKTIEIDKPLLTIANKTIPYSWTPTSENQDGWVCIFTSDFLQQNNEYHFPILNFNEMPLHFLSNAQLSYFIQLFEDMHNDLRSNYIYKYGLLQAKLHSFIHQIQKLESPHILSTQTIDASTRITYRFLELMEQQFPIQEEHSSEVRSPQYYAAKLCIHANYLNASLKKVTGKTSSTLIAERIIAEAKELLLNPDWNITQISDALGFEYSAHFSNFFRKHTGFSPKQIRNTYNI